MGEIKTWMDIAALVLSAIAIVVSVRTWYSDRKWKEEVENRRPFIDGLRKLSLTVAQQQLAIGRCTVAHGRLSDKLTAIEEKFGPRLDLAKIRKALEDSRKLQEEAGKEAETTNQEIMALWTIKKPSSEHFASVERLSDVHAKLLLSAQATEQSLKEQLDKLRAI
jgi:hypothetical protein